MFEECGLPGGVQMTLLPFAISSLLVYTLGFPVMTAIVIWKYRLLIMEDQLLRAKVLHYACAMHVSYCKCHILLSSCVLSLYVLPWPGPRC